MSDTHNLSSGLEDYIETIYLAESANFPLKGAELARKLNISRASVSEALSKLSQKGLIKYERYGNITLTQKGIQEAQKVYTKHSVLTNFFIKALDVNSKLAEENACRVEHIISDEIIEKMRDFIQAHH